MSPEIALRLVEAAEGLSIGMAILAGSVLAFGIIWLITGNKK